MNKGILAGLLLGASIISTLEARNQSSIDISEYSLNREVPFDGAIEWDSLFPKETYSKAVSTTSTALVPYMGNAACSLLNATQVFIPATQFLLPVTEDMGSSVEGSMHSSTFHPDYSVQGPAPKVLKVDNLIPSFAASGEIDLSSLKPQSFISVGIENLILSTSPSSKNFFSTQNIVLAGTIATAAIASAMYLWYTPSQAVATTSTALVPYIGSAANSIVTPSLQLLPAATNGLVSALTAPLPSVSAMIPALATMLWKPTLSAAPDILSIVQSSSKFSPSLATPHANSVSYVADAPSSALVTVAGQTVTSLEAANTISFYTNLVTYAANQGTSVADAFSLILTKNTQLAQFINLDAVSLLVQSNTPLAALPSAVNLLPSTAAMEVAAPVIDGSVPSITFHPDVRVAQPATSVVKAPKVILPMPSSFTFHPDYSVTVTAPKALEKVEDPVDSPQEIISINHPPHASNQSAAKVVGALGLFTYAVSKLKGKKQQIPSQAITEKDNANSSEESHIVFRPVNYKLNTESAYQAIINAKKTHSINPAEVFRILSHDSDPHFVESDDKNSKEFALSFYADATYFGNDFSDLQPHLIYFVDKNYLLSLLRAWTVDNQKSVEYSNSTMPLDTLVVAQPLQKKGSTGIVSVNFAGRTILIDPIIVQKYMKRHNVSAQEVIRAMYPKATRNIPQSALGSSTPKVRTKNTPNQIAAVSKTQPIEWDYHQGFNVFNFQRTANSALLESTPVVMQQDVADEGPSPRIESEETRIAFNTNAAYTTVLSAYLSEGVHPAEMLRLLKSPLNINSNNTLATALAENFWKQEAEGDINLSELRQLLERWVMSNNAKPSTSWYTKAKKFLGNKIKKKKSSAQVEKKTEHLLNGESPSYSSCAASN